MSNLGMGVMINMLAGENGAEHFEASIGKEIVGLKLSDDRLYFSFGDDTRISIEDDGQSCCENRYMTCDDDLEYFVGAKLIGASVRDGEGWFPDRDKWIDCHDIQFLVVDTSKGSFTVATHNEHNGYYGGFFIRIKKA